MNFAPTLAGLALVGLLVLPADAQERRSDRPEPADVSLPGSEGASRGQDGTQIGWLGMSGPPYRCVEAITDQKGGECLQGASHPIAGLLFPYPGINNTFTGPAFVGGGENNVASGIHATVGGGYNNTATGSRATVGGGRKNTASVDATVGGGYRNTASGNRATVGGGGRNTASGYFSTVGGGFINTATGGATTVGGGVRNIASGVHATVGGGGGDSLEFGSYGNTASGSGSTVGGGRKNIASGYEATVGGGYFNRATENSATVGGGNLNTASLAATVGGGTRNTATGILSAIGGGGINTASGYSATVPGGFLNIAQGSFSFAAGRSAIAQHDGAFVWGDSFDVDKTSSVADEFNVYCSGGARFFSNSAATTGVLLAPGGGSWTAVSSREMKENVEPVDVGAVLDQVMDIPISTWNYKEQSDSIRHMGPMAQDFYAAFGLGLGETTIDTIDPDGVALAAIQGVNAKLEHEIADVRAENQELRKRLERLEELVAGTR